MSEYNAPTELRTLEKMLTKFAYTSGCDLNKIFDDWLYFIISNFNMNLKIDTSWREKYTKEQDVIFHNMMCEWIQVMEKQIKFKGWYDAFGELHQTCIAGKTQKDVYGQFFTPTHICDFMVDITTAAEPKKVGIAVGDPACGSGRNLLAYHAKHEGNYMYAEDITKTCCMMTVANFLIHGAVGEVVWHDSLDPESWYGGWKVNEHLNNRLFDVCGIPHMREMEKEESKVIQYWQEQQAEILRNTPKVPVQLELALW